MKKLVSMMLVCLLIISSLPITANGDANDLGSKINDSKKNIKENHKKLSSDLIQLVGGNSLQSNQTKDQIKSSLKNMKSYVSANQAQSNGLKATSEDLVYVYIYLEKGVSTKFLNPYVNTIANRDEKNGIVAAWVGISKLNIISSQTNVRAIETVLPPVTRGGSRTSEGDAVHQADAFRRLSGKDGTGIKVGVISDGVDNWAAARASGDLPANVTVLSNLQGGDEGTAMLEIIYDLAPGAELYFHDCGSNILEFNAAIDELVAAGCDIIVDDIGWISEPYFEDGIIASHIDQVIRNNNIAYISSAGNDALGHYQGKYKNDGQGFHDFNSTSGVTLLPIRIPAGESMLAILQWNDKFGASANDFDMALLAGPSHISGVLDVSLYIQDGDEDPFEYVMWTNTGSQDLIAYIDIYKGVTVNKTLELFVYGADILNYGTTGDSIFGHPAVPGVITVGAINADNTSVIAPYSSQGDVTISYPTAHVRRKPDVSGIDGVSVTGAGGFPSEFYGTSAAAPHVAAIAALIWSQNPSQLSADDIKSALYRNVTDRGPAGLDSIYGYGLIDAASAVFPDAPESLTATPSDRSVILSWSANTDIDLAGYQLEYKRPSSSNWSNINISSSLTSYTLTGLDNGFEYLFRLKARDTKNNISTASDIVTAIPFDNVAPAIPANLRVASVDNGSITLNWNAPPASDLSGYELSYRLSAEPEGWANIPLGNVTAHTITGLTNTIEYSFRIRAKDTSDNWSEFSSIVTGIPADMTPPAVPTGFAGTVGINNDVTLTWNANTESDLGGYEIAYQKNRTSAWLYTTVNSNAVSTTIDGLLHNSDYNFKIRAVDVGNHWSAYTAVIKLKAMDRTPPTIPNGLTADVRDKSVVLNWSANSETDLSGYTVEYKLTSASAWSRPIAVNRTATTYTVSKLINGSEYQFRIKAKDAAGNLSDASAIISAVPTDTVPPPIPTSLKVSSVNDNRVELSWKAVKATDLAGYQLEYKISTDEAWNEIQIGRVTKHTITDLINNTEYSFRISSKDTSDNISDYSSVVTGTPMDKTPPAVPTGLAAVTGTNGEIELSWNANVEDDLDCYEITYQPYKARTWTTIIVASDEELNLALDGFAHNKQNSFKIRAKDHDNNWSAYSRILKVKSINTELPATPTGFQAEASNTSIVLSWEANSEEDLGGYQVEYKLTTASRWTVKVIGMTETSYTLTNLINGSEYQVRFKAKDTADNWSSYTEEIFVTPTAD